MSKLPTKMPDDWNWEVHNLVAYEDNKKKFARGEITLEQLREFEEKYKESEGQREERWKREHVLQELAEENAKNFEELFALHSEGKLKPEITKSYSLDEAVEAIKSLEDRTATGKVVIEI